MAATKKTQQRSKWKDEYLVDVYLMARDGCEDAHIYRSLGMCQRSWSYHRKTKEPLRNVLARGRADSAKKAGNVKDHVYGLLPHDLQELWNKLEAAADLNVPQEDVTAILATRSKECKQRLFLHAWLCSNWNASLACRKLGMALGTYKSWLIDDGDFRTLHDGMDRVIQEYLISSWAEKAIIDKDPACLIYGLQTKCKDRGFAHPRNEATLNINHRHDYTVDTDRLLEFLSVAALREVRDAIVRCEELDRPKTPERELSAPQLSYKVIPITAEAKDG